jgi:hypothetical protein
MAITDGRMGPNYSWMATTVITIIFISFHTEFARKRALKAVHALLRCAVLVLAELRVVHSAPMEPSHLWPLKQQY